MEKAVSKMTYEQRQTAAGKELIKTLQDLKEASETYGDSVEKTTLATVKYRASMMDFSKISSISDYAKTKEQLSKQTSQYAEVSEEEGKKAATAYLRTYKNTLYKDFEIKSKILQKIQGDSKQGLQALDKMSDQDLIMLNGVNFKDPTVALILSALVGGWGVDRFYIGDIGLGVLKLVTGGGLGVWWIVDLFVITGKTKENNINNFHEAIALQEMLKK